MQRLGTTNHSETTALFADFVSCKVWVAFRTLKEEFDQLVLVNL